MYVFYVCECECMSMCMLYINHGKEYMANILPETDRAGILPIGSFFFFFFYACNIL